MSPNQASLHRARIQEQWDEFSDQELDWIQEDPQRLIQSLINHYGIPRDEAAREVAAFMERDARQGST